MSQPNNPTPTPTAEDFDDARDLPYTIIDRLIARFEEARNNADRALALARIDPRLDKWAELEVNASVDARYTLTEGILVSSPGFGIHPVRNCDRSRWPARAIRSGDWIYLVHPDPDREDEGSYNKPALMKLVVFDAGAIVEAMEPSKFADQVLGPMDSPPASKR